MRSHCCSTCTQPQWHEPGQPGPALLAGCLPACLATVLYPVCHSRLLLKPCAKAHTTLPQQSSYAVCTGGGVQAQGPQSCGGLTGCDTPARAVRRPRRLAVTAVPLFATAAAVLLCTGPPAPGSNPPTLYQHELEGQALFQSHLAGAAHTHMLLLLHTMLPRPCLQRFWWARCAGTAHPEGHATDV